MSSSVMESRRARFSGVVRSRARRSASSCDIRTVFSDFSVTRALLRSDRTRPRHIAAAGEEAGDRDVLVELLPMDAVGAEEEGFAVLGGAVEQAGEPDQRDPKGAAVLQIDPHLGVVEADGG